MNRKYQSLTLLKERALKNKPLQKNAKGLNQKALPHWGTVKPNCLNIYDQGDIGSCTANAFCGAFKILDVIKNGQITFEPSRLFVYYYERLMEGGNPEVDSGADVVDGENYVKNYGVCSESLWPYDTTKFAIKPPVRCSVEALNHKISSYEVFPMNKHLLNNIKQSIINHNPVMIGCAVYESFESEFTARTGMVTLPTQTENEIGGHEMCIVGYNDDKNLFTVMNSWGPNWGHGGFCYLPYDYITNPQLSFEFTHFTL